MTVEVETAEPAASVAVAAAPTDAAMLSPTNSSVGAPESLRLSEIETAHLCATGRMKMEELFRQWLNVEGTKEMIQGMVEDLRAGKELNFEALLASTFSAAPSSSGGAHSGGESPSRSPRRPPNYNQFSMLGGIVNGDMSPNNRKRHHLVSLFGDELHAAAEAVAAAPPAKQVEDDAVAAPAADDVDMNENQADEGTAGADDGDATMSDDAAGDMAGPKTAIPRFFTPGEARRGRARGMSVDSIARKTNDIESRFQDFPEGMKVEDFVAITKDLCGFPSFFNAPFFRRVLTTEGSGPDTASDANPEGAEADSAPQRITREMFQSYWSRELAPFDNVERFFRVVKQPQNSHIERDDFAPFLHELLKYHPGLEFLGGTPEFQEKYALTVVVRIFYSVDRDSSGKITLRKLRRSNLVSAFNCVDEEEDINKVNSYFSYEHFYVLYCKFWELDTDHDFLLSPDDLVRYGSHALTRIIVDRIFERARRPFARVQTLTAEEKKKMSYEDFIYFMLSEEDKSNPVSLRYWFELIDTNEDGVIRSDEMRAFYKHQVHRMECLGHEVVPFEDILCQMADLLHPENDGEFYHKDLIRSDKIRVSGVFFNVLFNLSKFIEFEQRDPFLLRQQLAEPELTDWDRYARAEYARLAMEEESREEDTAMDIDTMDGWYVSDEQEEEVDVMGAGASGSTGGGSEGVQSQTVEAPF